MKRVIAFALAMLFAAFALCGCKKTETEPQPEETQAPAFALTKENLGLYSIVVADKAESGVKEVASSLAESIKRITGSELKVKSDFVAEGSDVYCEEEYEILLGYVDRDAINELYVDIRENDSGYAMIGKKVVLIGRSEKAMENSYTLFLADILKDAAKKDVLMSDGERKVVDGAYIYESMRINGVDIKEYRIIYPAVSSLNEKEVALSVQSYIKGKTGYVLSCESDKSEKTEHEIQIGQTNRIGADLLAQRASSGFGEGKYYIAATDNGAWLSAANAFELNAAANRLWQGVEISGDTASLKIEEGQIYKMEKISVSMLTYNVLYNFSENRNADHVLRSLEEQNADVFGLNEVTEAWSERIDANFKDTYTLIKGKVNSSDEKSPEYEPILFKTAKFELVESGTKWMSDTPDKVSKYKEGYHHRIFTYAVLRDKATGVQFMYIQAHLENNNTNYDSPTARSKQSAALKKFTDQYLNLPIIIGGDMNAAYIKDISPLYTNTRFVNSSTVAKEKKESGTWVGKEFNSISDRILDYIFVTTDTVTVSKYEAVDNKIDGKYPSDHIPVRIDAVIYQ